LRCRLAKLPEFERDMNEVCEMWSLPWHALQRDLALGLSGGASVHYGAAIKTSGATVKAINVQSATVCTNSWLGRARLRVASEHHPVRQ
jgi:hypothetical protein